MLKRFLENGTDPVCGMSVDTGDPPGGTYEHSGTTYYFCGNECRKAFEQDPSSFLQVEEQGDPIPSATHGGSGANSDPTAPILFTATDDPSGEDKFVDVVYQCVCGCRPGARVETGSTEAGSEHCCCGRVHFAGVEPERQLRLYMAERAKTNMDEDVGPYVYARSEATTATGKSVAISYAQPVRPRK
ncbi:MAG: YHS domain-containing protein [Dehalococcoidia bacterium]|nr:YHS domain-containing protein [Dehalococcoidia bacterium]